MKLGVQVGLDRGHIAFGGDPATLPQRGTAPPVFGPYLSQPNGCMDQDVTYYGARPRPRRLCVRWGPRSALPQRGTDPQFSAHICCGQLVAWIKMSLGMELGLDPGNLMLDRDPDAPSPKGDRPQIIGPCLL